MEHPAVLEQEWNSLHQGKRKCERPIVPRTMGSSHVNRVAEMILLILNALWEANQDQPMKDRLII